MKYIRKTSVFVRWLISYLIMLVMMVLASFAMYFYSYNIINRQQECVNEIMLEKIQTEIDAYFKLAGSTAISLIMDYEVDEVMSRKDGFDVEDRTLLYNVYEIIRNKMVASEEFDSIFIYFLHGDTVLSEEGHVDKALFYELYYKNTEMTEPEFSELMEQRWTGDVVKVKNSNDDEELIFLRNSFPRENNELDATIGISISCNEIIAWMNELKWQESTQVIVINDEGVLCSNGSLGNVLLKEYSMEELSNTDLKKVTLLKEKYHIVSIPSTNNNFYYLALTPSAEIQQEAHKIQIFMVVLLSACLTIGVFIAYVLTRTNYSSLKRVMDSFGEFNREAYDNNEYQWLLDQKLRFYNEHQEAKRKISEKEMILRQQYLYRLVSLPYDSKHQKYMDFAEDKLFEKPYSLVSLFFVESLDPESIYAKMDRSLMRFVLNNILEELLAGRLTIEFVDLTDCFACIINMDKETEELREVLEEVLDEMQRFMKENMQMQLSVVFGSCQTGIDGVYPSYLLAREAAEYRTSMLDAQFIWYEDIKNKHTLYQYSSETEQKIINAISVGRADDACVWIDEVINLNYHKREITQSMKKCLVSEIVGTIIKGAEQGSRTEFILDYMDENAMPEHWNEEKILEYLHNMVNGLCEDIRNNEMLKREDKQFGWQVIEYVQQNYQDPDLNISITALHFGITPSYLSSLFKEQTGLNLLEYINHTRVENAKKLLEEGCSLTEVCDKTGFRSSGALIRVFKKITGVTPGQMKKMLGQINKE